MMKRYFRPKSQITITMQAYYEGQYFNGLTSHSNPVTVRIVDKTIEICYHPHDTMETAVVRWTDNRIREIETDYSGKTSIRYGEFPFQTLDVYSKQFGTQALEAFPQLNKGTPYAWLRRTGTQGVLMATLGVFAFLAFAYFYLIPWVGESLISSIVSESYEKELGDETFKSITGNFETNDEKTVLLNEYIKTLNLSTTYDIQGTVVNSDMVNAFALMGGRVVVFDSILQVMKSSDELAALLAHEVTHVQERHVLRNLGKRMANGILVTWLFGDVSGMGAVLVDGANGVLSLSYSRKLEEDADKKGFARLLEAGVDPKGMLELMQHLKAQEGIAAVTDSKWSKFLSDHPLTDDRISYINGLLQSKQVVIDSDKKVKLERIWIELTKQNFDED